MIAAAVLMMLPVGRPFKNLRFSMIANIHWNVNGPRRREVKMGEFDLPAPS